uniref:Splicing factor YJU2 n=1 Tax=Albugo laibachii Nc14 TaxID=890382 RepID=F0WC02_9STRA|nr:coiledcoil domaincontaining protein 94 putative [Albugo laibachii Nc14]|eukprot:CCA18683.1 coiledcoil domaincontaining protein 94 putative [Albugo laibachii Nc14]
MGERKVLNKYFPPDFDPSLVPRRQGPKNKQMEVRMMLPFSIQCDTCGEYMYRGKKFNSRKEEVVEENYLGLRIYRFYIKCVTCSSEITFKTDPKAGDYAAEHGCSRNFEPWRETQSLQETALKKQQDEEQGDSMKALENRTVTSKHEMDLLDALDEMKAINQRHARIDTNALLVQLAHGPSEECAEKEDQELAKLIFSQKKESSSEESSVTDRDIKRYPLWQSNTLTPTANAITPKSAPVHVKRKLCSVSVPNNSTRSIEAKKVKVVKAESSKASLVADYTDSSDDKASD